ncbi:MAG: cadherin domain-containing protein [Woeseiaceae bacterium]|nr:cadherin domain-containing protein [Woeseiaceae bacterium]
MQADAGTQTESQPQVNEGALDSSGISDNSSQAAPDTLSVADDFAGEINVEVEVETGEVETQEVAQETSQVASETTVERKATNTVQVTQVFETLLTQNLLTIDENSQAATVASVAIDNPSEIAYTVQLTGIGSELFSYDQQNNELIYNGNANYESDRQFDLTIIFTKENNDIVVVPVNLIVNDINEQQSVNVINATGVITESSTIDSLVASTAVIDPENGTVSYALSGTDAAYFSIDENGNIKLATLLDYEDKADYEISVDTTVDGLTVSAPLSINIVNINEAPMLTSNLAAVNFAETSAVGTTVVTASASDPESEIISYSLSGTDAAKFSIDSNGVVTIASALDYETKNSYNITVNASDGTNNTISTHAISLTDVNEAHSVNVSISNTITEAATVDTVVASSTVNDPENGTISYSLSGTDSAKFSIDSNGNVKLASLLDYETKTSYSINVIATVDGITESKSMTLSIADVNEPPTLNSSLAATNFIESSAVGTTVATSSSSDPESGTVTYSLSGTDAAKFSIASNGTVTIASTLDYETKTSYNVIVNVTDGTNSVSSALAILVTDAQLENLVTAIQNTPFVESNGTNTSVATVSSIANGESEALVYTLSGTGSDKFTVNASSGAITNNTTLDFEEAKSYNLTLTATGQSSGDTATSAITVPVKNIEELQSNTLRYSAAVTNVSRTGFSATGTRGGGPSGTNLGAYQQEQIITTTQSTATNKTLADYDNIGSDNVYTPVSIVSGDGRESVAVDNLDFRYFYPLGVTSGAGQYQFSPGQGALDGHYKTVDAQSEVVSNIAQSEVLSAGRFDSKLFWMTLDKDAETINYSALQGGGDSINVLMFHSYYASSYLVYETGGWKKLATDKGYSFQDHYDTSMGMESFSQSELNDYEIIIDMRLDNDTASSTEQTLLENWMKDSGSDLWIKLYGERCCQGNGQNSLITSKTNVFLNNVGAHLTVSGGIDADGNSGNFGGIVDAGLFGSGNFYEGLNGLKIDPSGMAPRLSHIKDLSGNNIGQLLFNKAQDDNNANLYAAGYITANELESGVNSDIFLYGDINGVGGSNPYWDDTDNIAIANWLLDQAHTTSYIGAQYHSYLDQVVLTGDVYTDAMYNSFTNNNKRIIALNVMPIENHLGVGTSADFFYPSFFSSGFYSSSSMDFKTLAPDYCAAVGNNSSACNTYANHYDWAEQALDPSQNIDTARFGATSEMPEGTSQWYQIMNPAGKGVGLQAQLSIQDSYDGAGGSTTRDDQQSYLGVMINTMDKRSNDTTKYSAGDTGQYIDGTHYWSYQKRTNQTNDGLGVQLGVSPIECASSSDRGCLIAEDSASDDRPIGMMVTTSDPYKNGPMSVGVKYNTNSDTWNTDTLNQMAISGEFRTTSSASLINDNLPYTGNWAEFDGNNDWFEDNGGVHPLYKSGEPWAFGGVVRVDSTPSEGTFFGRSTGWNSGNSVGGIHLGVTADDKLIFLYGNTYNRLQFTGSDTLSTGTDYGFYVDYDGGTTGVSSGITAQYFSRFRIKQVNLTTGAVSDVPGSWTAPNYGIGSNGDGGQMFVGAKRTTESSLDGRVYTFTATTLMDNETPDDTEISTFIRNPVQWVNDYKIGESYRDYDSSATINNFQLNDSESSKSTAVFLMYSGDDIQEHDDGLAFNASYQQAINYVGSTWNLGNYSNSNVNNVQEGTTASDANQDYKSISDFRHSDFYSSTATTYNGFFTGIMEFNSSGTGNDQLASVRSGSTLASINFDATNDDVQVAAPLSVSTLPSNNYTNTWDTVDTGELVLNFGDTDNTAAKSAYISNEIFAAELKDDGAQIDGSSGGASNMAGVMVSYDTLDKEDSDLFHTNGNDPMPNAEYATWGFWAMGAVDVSPNSGTQTGAVHLGTWVAGELVAANEIPTSGSASMSGAAIVKAAYRHNQTGTNYDVHKYTTTADVAATFNWGSSAYTGTMAVTNFDDKNPIVSNAGFTSFNVSLNSNNANTYTGTSTTSIQNGWSGGAAIAGALYGGDTVDETGGRINVSLHKNGSTSDAGANDFYIAEGIYLLD